MEVSKITFTKETLNKMKKDLTNKDLGVLRYKRLQELDESGKLSFIKTRRELAVAVGYRDEHFLSKGSSWVNRMLKRGYVSETLLGFNEKTKTPEHEYHLTRTKPNFVGGRKKMEVVNPVADKKMFMQVLEQTPQIIEEADTSELIKIKITKQDLCIEIELKDQSYAGEFIKQLL